MFSILSEFTRRLGEKVTFIILGENELDQPQRYTVDSTRLLLTLGGAILLGASLLVALLLLTPMRSVIPGQVSQELRQDARRRCQGRVFGKDAPGAMDISEIVKARSALA